MLTRCPNCNTAFHITAQQLEAAEGTVRCGRCQALFDARASLADERDDDPEGGATRQPEPAPPEPTTEVPTAEIPDVLAEDLRALTGVCTPRRSPAWLAAMAVLSVTLALQYTYFMRAELAQHERWRPWLERLCSVTGCRLPLQESPEKIRWLSRDVTLDGAHGSRLMIRAVVVNTAAHPVAFPLLQVKLFDLPGKVVALRRFRPREYLAPGTDIQHGLQPDTPVTIALDLLQPRADTAGYELDFQRGSHAAAGR